MAANQSAAASTSPHLGRMNVLRVSGLGGNGTGDGRHATQKRTSAGLHANLELEDGG